MNRQSNNQQNDDKSYRNNRTSTATTIKPSRPVSSIPFKTRPSTSSNKNEGKRIPSQKTTVSLKSSMKNNTGNQLKTHHSEKLDAQWKIFSCSDLLCPLFEVDLNFGLTGGHFMSDDGGNRKPPPIQQEETEGEWIEGSDDDDDGFKNCYIEFVGPPIDRFKVHRAVALYFVKKDEHLNNPDSTEKDYSNTKIQCTLKIEDYDEFIAVRKDITQTYVNSNFMCLFNDSTSSDFTIKLNNDLFYGHRFLLSRHSEYFKSLFNFHPDLKESSIPFSTIFPELPLVDLKHYDGSADTQNRTSATLSSSQANKPTNYSSLKRSSTIAIIIMDAVKSIMKYMYQETDSVIILLQKWELIPYIYRIAQFLFMESLLTKLSNHLLFIKDNTVNLTSLHACECKDCLVGFKSKWQLILVLYKDWDIITNSNIDDHTVKEKRSKSRWVNVFWKLVYEQCCFMLYWISSPQYLKHLFSVLWGPAFELGIDELKHQDFFYDENANDHNMGIDVEEVDWNEQFEEFEWDKTLLKLSSLSHPVFALMVGLVFHWGSKQTKYLQSYILFLDRFNKFKSESVFWKSHSRFKMNRIEQCKRIIEDFDQILLKQLVPSLCVSFNSASSTSSAFGTITNQLLNHHIVPEPTLHFLSSCLLQYLPPSHSLLMYKLMTDKWYKQYADSKGIQVSSCSSYDEPLRKSWVAVDTVGDCLLDVIDQLLKLMKRNIVLVLNQEERGSSILESLSEASIQRLCSGTVKMIKIILHSHFESNWIYDLYKECILQFTYFLRMCFAVNRAEIDIDKNITLYYVCIFIMYKNLRTSSHGCISKLSSQLALNLTREDILSKKFQKSMSLKETSTPKHHKSQKTSNTHTSIVSSTHPSSSSMSKFNQSVISVKKKDVMSRSYDTSLNSTKSISLKKGNKEIGVGDDEMVWIKGPESRPGSGIHPRIKVPKSMAKALEETYHS